MVFPPEPANVRPIRWPASVAVAALATLMLASWLPHYLFWPWWPDADAWAVMARGWDEGIKPYRDVTCFNFPGAIYESWLLGRIFGWGRTWPFYALDASMLIGLGPLLAIWGRKRFGSALPGLLGWTAAVATYCGLNYTLVAQRDWQGPLLAVSALLVVQAWPGRIGSIASAILLAAGFAIRPHVVVFLPAVALALACEPGSWNATFRRWVEWGCAFGVAAVLAFSPLVVQGLIGDFLRGVRQASYGSGYGGSKPMGLGWAILRQIGLYDPKPATDWLAVRMNGWKTLATILALALMLKTSNPRRRALMAPWLVALVMVTLYAPLHPKPHGYLVLPLKLVWAIAWGGLAGLVIERLDRWRPAALLVFAGVAVPGVPAYCLPAESIDALLGRNPGRVPAAARELFAPRASGSPYRYDEYLATLAYLRVRTRPDTRVAAILRNVPFPAITGALGRVSPLPAESGVIWLWSVDPKLEGKFAESLDRAPDGSVVVWSPEEVPFTDALRLESLCRAIRKGYRFEARFGAFEVWRKPGGP